MKKEEAQVVKEVAYGDGIKLKTEEIFEEMGSFLLLASEEELYNVIESFDNLDYLCIFICDLYYILCLYSDRQVIYQRLEEIFFQFLNEEGPFCVRFAMIWDFVYEQEDTWH